MQKVDIIPVACPTCKNKRLFDIDLHTEGNIQIKCPKCRSIVKVKMHKQEIHMNILVRQSRLSSVT